MRIEAHSRSFHVRTLACYGTTHICTYQRARPATLARIVRGTRAPGTRRQATETWFAQMPTSSCSLNFCPVTPNLYVVAPLPTRVNSTRNPRPQPGRGPRCLGHSGLLVLGSSRGKLASKLRLRCGFHARLTVGGAAGAALMRVVEDVAAETERLLTRGATGVTNAAADERRAKNASAEKRAIFNLMWGEGVSLGCCALPAQKCALP